MEHCGRIGPALWEFVWLIDKITEEVGGKGIVLGGAPVKIERIAAELDRCGRTVRRNLDRLQDENYIERTRTPYGFTIRVRNSRKFQIWSGKEIGKNGRSLPVESGRKCPVSLTKMSDLSDKNVRNKEDAAVDATVDAAAGRLPAKSPLWNLVGLRPENLPLEFVRLCEGLFLAKGGQSLAEFVGVCMDSWQVLGNKIPGPFARAATTLRERQRIEPQPKPLEFLPELPFKAKGAQCPAQN
jgi:hypothetical protein